MSAPRFRSPGHPFSRAGRAPAWAGGRRVPPPRGLFAAAPLAPADLDEHPAPPLPDPAVILLACAALATPLDVWSLHAAPVLVMPLFFLVSSCCLAVITLAFVGPTVEPAPGGWAASEPVRERADVAGSREHEGMGEPAPGLGPDARCADRRPEVRDRFRRVGGVVPPRRAVPAEVHQPRVAGRHRGRRHGALVDGRPRDAHRNEQSR